MNELGQPIGWSVEFPGPIDLPERTSLTGRYCRVVPLNAEAHAQDLFVAYTDAVDVGDWTYLPYGPFADLSDFSAWLRSIQSGADPQFYAIIDLLDDTACGVASYLRIEPAARSIEVGHIHFSRRLQQTAAATEAMYLFMRRAFEGGYRRYEWKCDELNAPSRAAAARLGFSYEGLFRQATHYKGRNRDTTWFSVVDREWPTIDAEYRRWLDPGNFDDNGKQRTSLNHGRA